MLADQVETRLQAQVAELAGERTKTAADLSDMLARKQLPQSDVAAFVIHGGLRPRGEPESSANAFTQLLEEVVAIVLVIRAAGDGTGEKGLVKLNPLILSVIAAIAGWTPDEVAEPQALPIGDFRLSRGQLVSMQAGTLIYQLEFACPMQLRIIA